MDTLVEAVAKLVSHRLRQLQFHWEAVTVCVCECECVRCVWSGLGLVQMKVATAEQNLKSILVAIFVSKIAAGQFNELCPELQAKARRGCYVWTRHRQIALYKSSATAAEFKAKASWSVVALVANCQQMLAIRQETPSQAKSSSLSLLSAAS